MPDTSVFLCVSREVFMAENKVKLTFTLSDGSKKETEFILPDATVNVQADVYDRTPDVAAIPSMF